MVNEHMLYLKNQGSSWFMDKITFLSFWDAIGSHYVPMGDINKFERDKVCFAEITHADLLELSCLFAGYVSKDDMMVLIPLKNNHLNIWTNMFSITVYKKEQDSFTPYKVNMVVLR